MRKDKLFAHFRYYEKTYGKEALKQFIDNLKTTEQMKEPLTNINPVVNNGALMCGRMKFKGSELTVSVIGRAKESLLETVMMFSEYFSEHYPDKWLEKLDLFIKEGDMHEGHEPFQTTHFND